MENKGVVFRILCLSWIMLSVDTLAFAQKVRADIYDDLVDERCDVVDMSCAAAAIPANIRYAFQVESIKEKAHLEFLFKRTQVITNLAYLRTTNSYLLRKSKVSFPLRPH